MTEARKWVPDSATIVTTAEWLEYRYDVEGNLVARIDKKANTEERYVYDGQHIIAVLDGDNAVKTQYLRGDQVDEIYAQFDVTLPADQRVGWYVRDRQQSVVGIFSNDNEDLWAGMYFNGALEHEASALQFHSPRFQYTGRYWDATVQLQNNRARWYDPNTGRWTSEDPLEFADTNPYRYVRNNSVNFTDPSGKHPLVPVITTAVGAVAGFVAGGLTGENGWDWSRAWAGAGSGAMVGLGVGLVALGHTAAGGLFIGAGIGSAYRGGLLTSGKSVDWAGYGMGTLEGGFYGFMIGSGVGVLTSVAGIGTAGTVGTTQAVAGGLGRMLLGQGVKGGVGFVHGAAEMAATGERDVDAIVANGTMRAVFGLVDPTPATYLSAVGAGGGALIGWGLDGQRGLQRGMALGDMAGGIAGGFRYGWRNPIGDSRHLLGINVGSANMKAALKYAGWDMLGAGIGGAYGYARTGDFDQAMAYANHGRMVANIAGAGLPFLRWACFTAGMPIRTRSGFKLIEQLVAGDKVLARSEFDPEGMVAEREVLMVFVSEAPILEIEIRGRTIRSTHEHPFWVRAQGWTAANKLQAGDELSTHDGRWVAVEKVVDNGEVARVYNVCVEEYHTYFVGCEEWGFDVWAHNASRPYLKGVTGPTGRPVQDVIEGHHVIPWDNKRFNHQKHGLVVKAGNVQLKTYLPNLKDLKGHAGRHSTSIYHPEIQNRMNKGLVLVEKFEQRLLARGASAAEIASLTQRFALKQLDKIIARSWSDIGSGMLRLYRHKDVIII